MVWRTIGVPANQTLMEAVIDIRGSGGAWVVPGQLFGLGAQPALLA